ncbi:exodeoxyribonuclease I [Formosimonas limnophila]|uniref:Exodeoxyribonuclease I n=1 Tax=Formosimonas limnophila TaxID=1384487 RepID=A0A8J3G0J9_9BURK|nr:exodeoxyribonuclease I [Formosimonas limnophila]GHA75014.1 exodeoxyribonuclease I [Formosimonas limnophila]
MHTFLWHDYETFGKDTRSARPAQFAAIRTDADLNELGEPIELFCQPAPDFLPEPEACLITGILPQQCLANGVPEREFAQRILQELSEPNTIGVGYNTIRYDDEITRFMFWRNLIEPYAREWQNGCGRWDIIDLARVTYALRPEGIEWPKNEAGFTSFKLTDLTEANGIAHEAAHDAVSDVRATIALARLIRDKQPKLFEFYFKLRQKNVVSDEIGLHLSERKPFLHLSSMFPAERAHMALVYPLGVHPTNKNEVIVWDCAFDPTVLFALNADEIRTRMFTRADELADGVSRLPIKTIHLNKSPVVVSNLKVLDAAAQERCGLDVSACMVNAEKAARGVQQHDLSGVWADVFHRVFDDVPDVDEALYAGFVPAEERRLLERLRLMTAEEIARANPHFSDERLAELVFRYRARNFPESLSAEEAQEWQKHCFERLHPRVESYITALETLAETQDDRGQAVLDALSEYVFQIVPEDVY